MTFINSIQLFIYIYMYIVNWKCDSVVTWDWKKTEMRSIMFGQSVQTPCLYKPEHKFLLFILHSFLYQWGEEEILARALGRLLPAHCISEQHGTEAARGHQWKRAPAGVLQMATKQVENESKRAKCGEKWLKAMSKKDIWVRFSI